MRKLADEAVSAFVLVVIQRSRLMGGVRSLVILDIAVGLLILRGIRAIREVACPGIVAVGCRVASMTGRGFEDGLRKGRRSGWIGAVVILLIAFVIAKVAIRTVAVIHRDCPSGIPGLFTARQQLKGLVREEHVSPDLGPEGR